MKPGEPVSKNDAAVLLRAVQRKLKTPLVMRRMPHARKVSPHHADLLKAAGMILAEIQEAVARCAALEREK